MRGKITDRASNVSMDKYTECARLRLWYCATKEKLLLYICTNIVMPVCTTNLHLRDSAARKENITNVHVTFGEREHFSGAPIRKQVTLVIAWPN